jgi:FkbM family methyltransferase
MNKLDKSVELFRIHSNLKLEDVPLSSCINIHHYFYSTHKLQPPSRKVDVVINEEQEIINIDGFKFCSLQNDTCVSDALRSGELFEKFLLSLLSTIVPNNKNILDIGANIGVWSIVFSKVTSGTVYAFEPQYKVFDCLEKNTIINDCSNVKVYNIGLSDCANTLTMNASYDKKENFGAFKICENGCLTISTRRGDSLELTDIGFIKMDVEGHELEALNGLEKTITDNHPILLIEIHMIHHNSQKTLDKIISMGYTHVVKLSHCDYLFFASSDV